MKEKFLFIILLFPAIVFAQPEFDKYFTGKSMRFDFILGGNSNNIKIYQAEIKQEPFWAGSQKNLIDIFNYGSYRYRVFDKQSGSLIFSKGFSTLFQEWQTTAEAKKRNKTFYQTAIFPFPKNKIVLKIDARQWNGEFKNIFETDINPADYFIIKEKPEQFKTVEILKNGNYPNKVDIAILPEGYTASEMKKFVKDAKRVTGYLFDAEPFKSEKNKFNITAVLIPSLESGTDIPGENIYKNTHFNSSFYTFDIARYLTISDMKTVYDAASVVPYDFIYVLVNSDRYGGGGFYNFLTVCTAGNSLTKEVFVHEFGHAFAGLGDEYYTSAVAYENYYNLEVEPWEPNLTTLVDFGSKWKQMVPDSIPVPTPRIPRYKNTVGVFEGGGYMKKGIYSPFMDCRMKSNKAKSFCPVCKEAIKKVIRFYSE